MKTRKIRTYRNKLVSVAFISIIELTEPKGFWLGIMGFDSAHSEEKHAMRKLIALLVLVAFAVAALPTASHANPVNGAQPLVKKHHHHHHHHKKPA